MHLNFENRCITTSVKAQNNIVQESQRRLEPLNRRCDASVFKASPRRLRDSNRRGDSCTMSFCALTDVAQYLVKEPFQRNPSVSFFVLTDIVVFNTTSVLLTDVMINVSQVNVGSIPDDKCLLEPTMKILFVLVLLCGFLVEIID